MRYLCPEMHTLGWKFNIFQAMWGNILKIIFFPSYSWKTPHSST